MSIRIVRLGTPRAPSQPMVSAAQSQDWTDARWAGFAGDYRAEMRGPVQKQLLALLAQMSRYVDFSVGCYCERGDRCHRSVLAELLREQGAVFRQ